MTMRRRTPGTRIYPVAAALLALTLASGNGFAADESAHVREEIRLLLAPLGNSGCSFQRNGILYSGSQAGEHLAMKMRYAVRWRAISSAEEFIHLLAGRSSETNRDYTVLCPPGTEVPAQTWLLQQLAFIRRKP
jgi:hypothetical protein